MKVIYQAVNVFYSDLIAALRQLEVRLKKHACVQMYTDGSYYD